MWFAQVEGEWYKVLDVIDTGEGQQNSYLLEGIGVIPYQQIEQLSIESPSKTSKAFSDTLKVLKQARYFCNHQLNRFAEDNKNQKENKQQDDFDLEKALRVSPDYWKVLNLEKHKSLIKNILKTSAEPSSAEFCKAVYKYQISKPSIKLKDGILGPETFGAISENQPEIYKEVQLSQSKSFSDFLEKNQPIASRSGDSFNLEKFKNQIGRIESGGKYDIVNSLPGSTATGKYQFVWSIWERPISNFVGKQISREQFLNSPRLQEDFMDFYTKKDLYPAAIRLRQKYPSTAGKLTLEQLAGLIHFKGERDAAKILDGKPDPTTRGNVSVQHYLSKLV